MELVQRFQNLMAGSRVGFALIAKHLGCPTVAVISFHLGETNALTEVQQLKLENLINDLYKGNTPKGGFYRGDDGSTKWSSKIGE